jgi:hypothetical protein
VAGPRQGRRHLELRRRGLRGGGWAAHSRRTCRASRRSPSA